jgi:glycosyltransferase involved in cell wall biosynthesis
MDDGSTEECAYKIDTIIAEYPAVTVYHLSHGGAAKARNEGIKFAKGKYICFADADDVVTKQFLFDLSAIEQNGINYDVVYGLVNFIKKGSNIQESSQLYPLELQ